MPAFIHRVLASICCFLAALACFAAPSIAQDAQDVYRVGSIAVPGFFTQDASGRYRGYGYDYLEALATYAGCSFEYYNLGNMDETIALDQGDVDLVIGSTRVGDPQYLYSEHSIGRTPLQISLAVGVDSDTDQPLRIAYFSPVFRESFLQDTFSRFFPLGHYQLVPYDNRDDLHRGLSRGTLQGVATDGLHPVVGTHPSGNLRMLPHYILYRNDEGALKYRLDAAANDMLTVTPNIAYFLMSRQEQHGAPLLLTREEKAWLAAHPHITAFASPKQTPYAYFDEGVHKGVTQDITERIERDLRHHPHRQQRRAFPPLRCGRSECHARFLLRLQLGARAPREHHESLSDRELSTRPPA